MTRPAEEMGKGSAFSRRPPAERARAVAWTYANLGWILPASLVVPGCYVLFMGTPGNTFDYIMLFSLLICVLGLIVGIPWVIANTLIFWFFTCKAIAIDQPCLNDLFCAAIALLGPCVLTGIYMAMHVFGS